MGLNLRLVTGIFLATVLLGSSSTVSPVLRALAAPAAPSAAPRLGGTELYGYLPYWQMTPAMVSYLSGVPVSTLELFSIGASDDGGLLEKQTGYRRITGPLGSQIIREAHARGQGVELVFTSFGYDRNDRLFGRAGPFDRTADVDRGATHGDTGGHEAAGTAVWARTATQLLALAHRIGVDGINVDVELIGGDAFDGYTSFLGALRAGLDAMRADAQLSVATMGSSAGADLALAAIAAGVDRVFLMGYDYHWSGSNPGASAPIDRLDGASTLRWSIETYLANGVPADRIILGLPLFGMSWPVASADRYAVRTGKGANWIPALHAALLTKAGFVAYHDLLEETEFAATPDATGVGWHAIFYDSPRTLRPKLVLAREARFAGAGFWAIGYERGLPGYLELMRDYRAGRVVPLSKLELGGR
jgi:glycosyl hydrolase family 18 (putative chitinase)